MHFFSGNFQCNCSSGFLFVAGSEMLYSKASLSNTRKAHNSCVLYRQGFLRKLKIFRKMLMSVSYFSNVTL